MNAKKNVLFPTDFSPYANYAMNYALAMARIRGGTLHVGHILDSTLFLTGGGQGMWMAESDMDRLEVAMTEHALARLDHLVQHAEDMGVPAKRHIVKGRPAFEIGEMAEEHHCGLVVIATHGRSGLDRLVFGSVAERVVREAGMPVLCIKHPEHEFVDRMDLHIELKRVLFPTDFSPFAEQALLFAVSMCREFGATLHLAHANELPVVLPEYLPELGAVTTQDLDSYGRERLTKIADGIQGLAVEVHQRTGHPYREINALVKEQDIDLVIIPTHGRTGVAHVLLGSTAEKVVRTARCPVLTVRPDHLAKSDAA